MNPMGVGFPDGNPAKSIVVDFKQVLTISPTSGLVRFALVSGPYGCLALQRGVISSTLSIPEYANTTSLSYSWVGASSISASTTADWYVSLSGELCVSGRW